MDESMSIDVNEIVAEMDDLGRAKFEGAAARVENRHLRRELARLSNAAQAGPDVEEAGDGA